MSYNLEQQITSTYYNDYKFFFQKPNVQGIGLGYKYVNGICTCEPSIHVFVNRKVTENCLLSNGSIPRLYKGIKTDVIEMGIFSAESYSNYSDYNNYNNICRNDEAKKGPYISKVRPVQSGYCVGLLDIPAPRTGTIGYIVIDNEQISRTYCFLSTNVTFADFGRAPIGSKIIQPSVIYGGRNPNNIIAQLLKYIDIKFSSSIPDSLENFNVVDSSVASFVNMGKIQLINPNIPDIGVPVGIIDAKPQQQTQWTGCVSGNIKGQIVSISSLLKVKYDMTKEAYFKNVVVEAGPQAQVQDRGALVCDKNKNAIGLLFASSATNFNNVICSIKAIESSLKVTLLTVNNLRH